MEVIRSRQNLLIKSCAKLLSNRRERSKTGKTLLDGTHLIQSALDAGLIPERVIVAESAMSRPEVVALASMQASFSVVDDTLFADISELDSISGIVALVPIPQETTPAKAGFVLVLDGIQDPGNVGSLMRTAAAAGVDQVWMSEVCADAWSPKVLRAGMGAHFNLEIIERLSLPQALETFEGKIVITSLDQSHSLYEANLTGDLALVMGSEGQGVSSEVADLAELKVRIPMHSAIESLNVGAAAAICMFERVRQESLS